MPLLKDNQLVHDEWQYVSDEGDLPATGSLILSLERWLNEGHRIAPSGDRQIGVKLSSDQSPTQILDGLEKLDLVALDFPAFTDGRAYSSARLLRERYGYAGEIRAVGNVLRDQYAFMMRCGVDTVEIDNDKDIAGWKSAAASMSHHYQPAADDAQAVWKRRHAAA